MEESKRDDKSKLSAETLSSEMKKKPANLVKQFFQDCFTNNAQ